MNSDLHNPAGVTEQSLGPNHRLLSTDELDKPLPEGAEWWSIPMQRWELACVSIGASKRFTYRIPLKPSDRLRQERDRLDELIGIVEAVEKGAEWEFSRTGDVWKQPPIASSLESLQEFLKCNPDWKVRLKPPPNPSSIPWTLETHPDVVSVKHKDENVHRFISQWYLDRVTVDGYGNVAYDRLHSDWLQRNGDPAGQTVTV